MPTNQPTDLDVLGLISTTGFRDEFSGTSLSNSWSATYGSGQSGTVGNGQFVLALGTNPGVQSTILRTSTPYTPPFVAGFCISTDSYLSNQQIQLGVISTTSTDGAAIIINTASNNDSTAQFQSTRDGIGSSFAPINIPQFLYPSSYLLFKIDVLNAETKLRVFSIGTTNSGTLSVPNSLYTCVPNISQSYQVYIKAINLANAPAFANNLRVKAAYLFQY